MLVWKASGECHKWQSFLALNLPWRSDSKAECQPRMVSNHFLSPYVTNLGITSLHGKQLRNYLKCIAWQCLSPPFVLFFLRKFDTEEQVVSLTAVFSLVTQRFSLVGRRVAWLKNVTKEQESLWYNFATPRKPTYVQKCIWLKARLIVNFCFPTDRSCDDTQESLFFQS